MQTVKKEKYQRPKIIVVREVKTDLLSKRGDDIIDLFAAAHLLTD